MKKICTLFIGILVCSVLSLQAQVTLTRSSHGFKPDNAHVTQEVEFMDPGMSGEGIVWDFSKLILVGDAETSSLNSQDDAAFNIGIVRENSNVNYIYNVTDYGNEYKGYIVDDFKVIYDRPLLKTQYPQTYGTFFEGEYGGSVMLKDRLIGNVFGNYSTFVDAAGTILLPGDIKLPVIRVKTTETINQDCNCGLVEVEKYLWYAQDVRYPVFVSILTTVTNSSDKTTKTTKKSVYNAQIETSLINTVMPAAADIAYTVSPNPFSNQIQIQYTLPQSMKVSIDLYSAQGMKLATILPAQIQEGDQTISSYIAPYTQREGTYFVKMQFGEKAYTEKLIKSTY